MYLRYRPIFRFHWFSGGQACLPDFAMIRDRAVKPFQKKIYSLLSFGWSGRAKDWQRFEEVSLVLAGLATPLVLSVHTIVSFDFATSVIPGWHTTIFPPYFRSWSYFLWICHGKHLAYYHAKSMQFRRLYYGSAH